MSDMPIFKLRVRAALASLATDDMIEKGLSDLYLRKVFSIWRIGIQAALEDKWLMDHKYTLQGSIQEKPIQLEQHATHVGREIAN